MRNILKKTLGRGSEDQKGFTLIELLVVGHHGVNRGLDGIPLGAGRTFVAPARELDHHGHDDRGQSHDDAHNDQQFNQGESLFVFCASSQSFLQ